jgi:hypothetical protein
LIRDRRAKSRSSLDNLIRQERWQLMERMSDGARHFFHPCKGADRATISTS